MNTSLSSASIRDTIAAFLPEAQEFLCAMIRYPSTPGQEHEVMLFIEQEFRKIPGILVERVAMSDGLRNDVDYSDPVPDIKYDGRFNLRVLRKGSGGGRNL